MKPVQQLKIKKDTTLLFLILSVAIIIRLLYSHYHPYITTTADSYGYYEHGKTILYNRSLQSLPDDVRVPFYPIFLNLAMIPSGNLGAEFYSKDFFDGMKTVAVSQTLLGLITLALIYKISQTVSKNTLFASLFTLFIAFDIQLFAWEKVVLTETLTVFSLAATTFIFIKLLEKPKISLAILLLFSFISSFLLKPIYILLPAALLPILPLYHRTGKALLISLILTLLFLSVPISYIVGNYIRYGYKGVNHVGDINLLGKILQFNLSVKEAKEFNYYYKTITHYRSIKGNPHPYRFLEYYDPEIYTNREKLNQLPSFNLKVIKSNFPEYTLKSALQIPGAMLETSEIITPTSPPASLLSFFFIFLFSLYNNFQYLTFIALPTILISIFLFLKKPTYELAILTLIGNICLYQIIFSAFLSYGEFGRLLASLQPFLYLLSFYWLGKLLFYKFTR